MRELRDGPRREIIAQLYLHLSTAFSGPWRKRGVATRLSFELVSTAGLVIRNHHRDKVTTAQEIQQFLGIPRSTVQRRCALLAQLGYLTGKRSEYWLSDEAADSTMGLSPAQFAEIEAAIHRASHLLHTMNDEDADETAA